MNIIVATMHPKWHREMHGSQDQISKGDQQLCLELQVEQKHLLAKILVAYYVQH